MARLRIPATSLNLSIVGAAHLQSWRARLPRPVGDGARSPTHSVGALFPRGAMVQRLARQSFKLQIRVRFPVALPILPPPDVAGHKRRISQTQHQGFCGRL
jgi:hypothetical protein